ncbi:MAG: 4'-phosphopantetheinyl transferase superfamily protein, partial [Odoribacter sp.]|nr:4'-phosphopantetheinyl transferase superfamily protein [Odoribacter sp.]
HEVRHLDQCESEGRRRLFFRYWAAKESFLKYTGTGLSASLSGFEVSFEREEPRILKPGFLQQIYMKECRMDADYVCFVCSESSETPEIIPFVFSVHPPV